MPVEPRLQRHCLAGYVSKPRPRRPEPAFSPPPSLSSGLVSSATCFCLDRHAGIGWYWWWVALTWVAVASGTCHLGGSCLQLPRPLLRNKKAELRSCLPVLRSELGCVALFLQAHALLVPVTHRPPGCLVCTLAPFQQPCLAHGQRPDATGGVRSAGSRGGSASRTIKALRIFLHRDSQTVPIQCTSCAVRGGGLCHSHDAARRHRRLV